MRGWSRGAKVAVGVLGGFLALGVAGLAAGDGEADEVSVQAEAPTTTAAPVVETEESSAPTTSSTRPPSPVTTAPPTTTTTAAPTTTSPPTTTAPPTTVPPTTVPPTTAPPVPTTQAPLPAAAPVDSGCHPSYVPCVPYDSDVDCAGGEGNGPSYTGRVEVVGPVGCEDG